MRFFNPDQEFLRWLAAYARGRPVWDVGCGEGHVVAALHELGVRAVGVEPLWSKVYVESVLPLHSCVVPMLAELCHALHECEDCLVLFCRPCHDGFVGRVLELLHPAAEVLYITPRPVGIDFDAKQWRATPIETPPTNDGEVVYVVTPRKVVKQNGKAKGRGRAKARRGAG